MTQQEIKEIVEQVSMNLRDEIRDAANKIIRETKDIDKDEWFNTRQAAAYLGWSTGTLYNRMDKVPCTKMEGCYRFSRKKLDEFIKRNSA